jgi:hypothetical protein
MDYAILLGKGNCFITDNHSETMTFWESCKNPAKAFNSSCRIAWSCTAIDQSICVFHIYNHYWCNRQYICRLHILFLVWHERCWVW